jgi:hypothetical protein
MPNWNSNTVTIDGPKEKIAALWARATAGEDSGLLNAMVPMPRELLAGDDWYDWCVENWGTKWDISNEGLQLVDNGNGTASITGYADSAWSPPLEAFQAYANANEDVYLELKYFEPGMSFTGVWDSAGGDAYWEDVGSLLETTQDEDAVLYDLLEHFNVWDWFESDEDIDIDAEEDA